MSFRGCADKHFQLFYINFLRSKVFSEIRIGVNYHTYFSNANRPSKKISIAPDELSLLALYFLKLYIDCKTFFCHSMSFYSPCFKASATANVCQLIGTGCPRKT